MLTIEFLDAPLSPTAERLRVDAGSSAKTVGNWSSSFGTTASPQNIGHTLRSRGGMVQVFSVHSCNPKESSKPMLKPSL